MNGNKGIANRILKVIDNVVGFDVVYAHCDYPCGIYDPFDAQMAVHTIIRMDDLIAEGQAHSGAAPTLEDRHNFVRAVEIKEKYAEVCKNEVRILWGDYFKLEHVKAHPELHELIFTTMKQASKARQTSDVKDAEMLLESVMKIAEIFWETKGIKTKRVVAPYPTKRQIVYPILE